ncbi:hypothetical protein [Falsiroseomonas sp. HW251]|uniref:hypothetical protein n=1 Tax=Falsiroseomonas sp. HW251 TaxID=3390998 RepID=UPI003D3139B7
MAGRCEAPLQPGEHAVEIRLEAEDGSVLGTACLPAVVHDLQTLAAAEPIRPDAMRRFSLDDLPAVPPQRANGLDEMRIQFRPPIRLAALQPDRSDLAQLGTVSRIAKRMVVGVERPALAVGVVENAFVLGHRMTVATPRGVPPGALVVEILPAFFVFQYFARLADLVGHRHRFYGQATPRRPGRRRLDARPGRLPALPRSPAGAGRDIGPGHGATFTNAASSPILG